MPTTPRRRHTHPAPFVSDADGEVTEVVGLLQDAVVALDRMWNEALRSGSPPAAIALGEASHGVHRALIALSEARQLPARGIRQSATVGAGAVG